MANDFAASKLSPFCLLDEPDLAFSADDQTLVDIHPLRGLLRHGPHSQNALTRFSPRIRIATVGPKSGFRQRGDLMLMLRQSHRAEDRKEYVPEYPGFEALFGVQLVSADASAHIKWPDNLEDHGGQPTGQSLHQRLVASIDDAMRRLALVRDTFDVALFHLPDKWALALRGAGFDAHDSLKALGAQYSIPTQVVNDRTFSFRYKASLSWRLAIATYVKAGGTPWKLAPLSGVPKDTAYIGLAYALRGDPRNARYVTCCSQVFDMDGGGMQFVAYEARDALADVDEARRNPFLSRDDMRAVIARSLGLYVGRNGGVLPRRLVIHKTTAFREAEVEGALDALAGVPEVECIEVSTRAGWRGVWLIESPSGPSPSRPAGYPVPRGAMLMRSGTSALLWAAGNAPQASTTGDYYQGKKSIPRPLVLTRHAGAGPLEAVALEALALTKMDWNNDALYDPVPVTIRYSQRLARTIANVPSLPGNAYPYRLFM
jgi:hypothetical protein